MTENSLDLSIVLSGQAGQGIQTLERLLLRMFKISGRYIFSYSEFMSRIRGGNNSTLIRVSSQRKTAFSDRIDIFIPFGEGAMDRFKERISSDTVIIGEAVYIKDIYKNGNYAVIDIPFTEMAKKSGGKQYLNLLIMGIFAAIFKIDRDILIDQVQSYFSSAASDKIDSNINAVSAGFEKGRELFNNRQVIRIPDPAPALSQEILLNGAETITYGSIAGGCNFISSYPMSPSTDVLVNFAKHSTELNIAVEQAEDEISAINMAIASWYAGGRAMVTTSGGGFALMAEGLSLAGATESPVVIHIGQRPGPATGLPTRTEQGDLLFSLFAGHGEFPRVIYAPGNFRQGFFLAAKSFHIADKYQVPVIILTDQYYLDSYSTIPEIKMDELSNENIIVETNDKYQRYKISDTGISPRGIPGYGTGIVCVDSDEHDEGGYITESFSIRTAQVNKRMRKIKAMEPDIIAPDLYGPENYTTLIVSWGSTLDTVLEALISSGAKDTALLHFTQLFPLHKQTEMYLKKARNTIIVENNFSSQFSLLIRMLTGFEFDRKITKYNGMPFSVEELTQEFINQAER